MTNSTKRWRFRNDPIYLNFDLNSHKCRVISRTLTTLIKSVSRPLIPLLFHFFFVFGPPLKCGPRALLRRFWWRFMVHIHLLLAPYIRRISGSLRENVLLMLSIFFRRLSNCLDFFYVCWCDCRRFVYAKRWRCSIMIGLLIF